MTGHSRIRALAHLYSLIFKEISILTPINQTERKNMYRLTQLRQKAPAALFPPQELFKDSHTYSLDRRLS